MANKLRALESPVEVSPGETIVFALEVEGVTSITGTPSDIIYQNNSDISSDVLSGNVSVSGNIITLKALAPSTTHRGQTYVRVITFVADGNTEVRTIEHPVIDERKA